MGKNGHSFVKTIIKPFYNHFGRCEILLRDIRIIIYYPKECFNLHRLLNGRKPAHLPYICLDIVRIKTL